MITSIASGLGIGSGIDTKLLVSELAANAKAVRETQIVQRERTNGARISAAATLGNGLEALVGNYAESAQGVLPPDLAKLARSFIGGFNLLRTSLSDATRAGTASVAAGALAGDGAARSIAAELARLPQTTIAQAGTYRTLSDIGINVSRAGTLTLDSVKFNAAVAAAPAEVSALLVDPSGLSTALTALKDRVLARDSAFTNASARYTRVAAGIAKERERMEADKPGSSRA